VLERWTRSDRFGASAAKRARIVLLAADGVANTRIAELTDAHANAGRIATSVCDRDQDRTPIWVVGGMDLPDHQSHILRAITRGMKPMLLHRYRGTGTKPGWSRAWLSGDSRCVAARQSGLNCDEYPFATSLEGGSHNNPSVQGVDPTESVLQGGRLSAFYGSCSVSEGDEFVVLPVPAVPTVGLCR
jgi:hypothetical protein